MPARSKARTTRPNAEKRAHLDRRPTGDDSLAPPRPMPRPGSRIPAAKNRLYVLLGDEHLAIGLRPQRPRIAGRGEATSEKPDTGSVHLFLEHVNIAHHRFGHDGRVEVAGEVNSNQILDREFSILRWRLHRRRTRRREIDKARRVFLLLAQLSARRQGTSFGSPFGSRDRSRFHQTSGELQPLSHPFRGCARPIRALLRATSPG